MAKRICNVAVTVVRKVADKDTRVHVVPGEHPKGFDFTAQEIKDIDRIYPGALSKVVADDEDHAGETDQERQAREAAERAQAQGGMAAAANAAANASQTGKTTDNGDGTQGGTGGTVKSTGTAADGATATGDERVTTTGATGGDKKPKSVDDGSI